MQLHNLFLGAFIKHVQALCPSRRKRWDAMFIKYEKEGKLDQSTYSLDEMMTIKDEPDQEVLYSNNVKQDKLSGDDKRLVHSIEQVLKSNLKQLILQREKTKLLLNRKDYRKIHPQVIHEIKRLRQTVSEEDLVKYIGWCVTPNEDVKEFIEEELQSSFKKLLLNMFQCKLDKIDHKLWNLGLLEEWHSLSRYLTEEDIVVYGVKAVSEHF